MENNNPAKKQADRYEDINKKHGAGEMTLENMIETMFITKQLDDLFLAMQSTLASLKKNQFNPMLLQRRDKITHDIESIQPLIAAMGMRFARHIERKYELKFKFLNGGVSDAPGEMSDFEKSIDETANKGKGLILPGS